MPVNPCLFGVFEIVIPQSGTDQAYVVVHTAYPVSPYVRSRSHSLHAAYGMFNRNTYTADDSVLLFLGRTQRFVFSAPVSDKAIAMKLTGTLEAAVHLGGYVRRQVLD